MSDDVKVFDFDDEIENDSTDRNILPAGEYKFTVAKFARERYQGSQKLPPCNMAVLDLELDGGAAGKGFVFGHNLYLTSKTEGFLCAFFRSIGLRKKGEKLKMDWPKVTGLSGTAKVIVEHYNGNDYNKIDRFLPQDEKQISTAMEQETSETSQGYTPGQF